MSSLGGNLILGLVFEWLKQDRQPFKTQTQIVSQKWPLKNWTVAVFEWSL
jgi:hypothetical protein